MTNIVTYLELAATLWMLILVQLETRRSRRAFLHKNWGGR